MGDERPPCPTCDRPLPTRDLSRLPHFPFCSKKCRLIDLGRWLDGDYRVVGPELTEEDLLSDPELADL